MPNLSQAWMKISIHALREEGDVGSKRKMPVRTDISIHALREEGDMAALPSDLRAVIFLSTPSARRATSLRYARTVRRSDFYPRPPRGGRPGFVDLSGYVEKISIHALREEGDFWSSASVCGASVFLSTPSARRATVAEIDKVGILLISIHALREEGDRMECAG